MGALSPAELGCLESHINVLSKTESELTLVLEDDFELCEGFDEELKKCLNELPDNFNGLWLGGRLFGKRDAYSSNLLKITGITGSYGYLVHRRFIPKLLMALKKRNKLADWAMSSVFENVFKSRYNLVKHRDGFSIIKNKVVEYSDLR